MHLTNTKFRSAQAIGRVASTLQRFTSDNIKFGNFFRKARPQDGHRVDLDGKQ